MYEWLFVYDALLFPENLNHLQIMLYKQNDALSMDLKNKLSKIRFIVFNMENRVALQVMYVGKKKSRKINLSILVSFSLKMKNGWRNSKISKCQ